MNNLDRYPSQVFWSDDDEGFIALAPDLPGCSAWGANRAEALVELKDAMEAWVQAANEAGNPIPPPSPAPSPAEYSGKLLLRMPKDLHARLAGQAKLQEVSLNQYVICLLSSASVYAEMATRAAATAVWTVHNPQQVTRTVSVTPSYEASTKYLTEIRGFVRATSPTSPQPIAQCENYAEVCNG
ncbi:type II toxin-antitoxin system HicB family antitoxin [Beijerinckia mobilis]|uniref:type II toxin-antitoxin system HicB family antitoxin n=1 Tax=Beijerinckia mobilis TaxID=231434 RepID=UPI0014703731|nr:type II toxin-antitoxin system HicB family antitoxin [Beijerinckia mobilis]